MNRVKLGLLALSVAIFPVVAYATHVPSGTEPVQYDGTLRSGSAVTGAIGWTDPRDGYDWYCMNVTKGVKVSISATRKSGNIKLNIGVLQGVTAAAGDAVGTLTKFIGDTSNSSTPDTTFTFTPDFDGPATIWISTWLGEDGGNYSVIATGIAPPPSSCIAGATENPTPAGPTSNITVTVPSDAVLAASGASTVVPISVSTANGFADDVNLSVAGLPDTATTTFDKATFANPGNGTANLTINTNGAVLPGTYFVTVIGSAANGTDVGASTFQFVIDCAPPYILGVNQPKGTSVSSGSTASLSVTADGTGPLTYQWYQGIPGVTTTPVANGSKATLTTPSINGQQMFWVRVSNACGSVDSQAATVNTK